MTDSEFMTAIRGLRPKQRDSMHAVAFGDDARQHSATLAVLEKRGLIESYEETLGGRFPVRAKRYQMPIHVHIAYCAWCSRIEERKHS